MMVLLSILPVLMFLGNCLSCIFRPAKTVFRGIRGRGKSRTIQIGRGIIATAGLGNSRHTILHTGGCRLLSWILNPFRQVVWVVELLFDKVRMASDTRIRVAATLLLAFCCLTAMFLSHADDENGELPLPPVPDVSHVAVDGIDLDSDEPFDISIPTNNSPPEWSHFKWCWAGQYEGGYVFLDDILTRDDHRFYASYFNYWNGQYHEVEDGYEYYICKIIGHGDGRHVSDPPLDHEDAKWAEVWFWPGDAAPEGGWHEPQAWVYDSDGNEYWVPVTMNGVDFPAGADGIHYGY